MKTINGYLKLSKSRKSLLLKSIFLTFLIRLSLYFLSFSKINSYTKYFYKSHKNEGKTVEDILWSVEIASNIIPRSTCLTRAIVGHIILSKYEYQSNLRIGVKKEDDFEAHAWLEVDNKVVLGKLDTEYIPLVNVR